MVFEASTSPVFTRNTAKFTLVVRVLLCDPPSCAVLPSMTSSYSRRASAVSPRSWSIDANLSTL